MSLLDTTTLTNLATMGMAGLVMPSATNKSHFEDVSSNITTTIIIVVIIILILWIMLLMSTYKLTGSALQTILCFFFGFIYLVFAFIYYGFSGYKFAKKA